MLQFLITGFIWFSSSAFLSTYANSTYLRTFGDPILHTFIRFAGSAVLGTVTLLLTKQIKLHEIPVVVKNVMQPALFLFCANYANSIALEKTGITLTYIIKACIPVFTVIICSVQGERFSFLLYTSLIPICLGVALACAGDLDFNAQGLIAGLCSAMAQTLMNIKAKSVQKKHSYTGVQAFMGMTIVCSFLSATLIMFQNTGDGTDASPSQSSFATLTNTFAQFSNGERWPLQLTLLASFAYHIEYALNFIFSGYVSNVSFSVSDIARRICIICIGSVMFSNTLTSMNWIGIVIAISGVLWYTYLNDQEAKKRTAAVAKKD